jgi:hypothetical protein
LARILTQPRHDFHLGCMLTDHRRATLTQRAPPCTVAQPAERAFPISQLLALVRLRPRAQPRMSSPARTTRPLSPNKRWLFGPVPNLLWVCGLRLRTGTLGSAWLWPRNPAGTPRRRPRHYRPIRHHPGTMAPCKNCATIAWRRCRFAAQAMTGTTASEKRYTRRYARCSGPSDSPASPSHWSRAGIRSWGTTRLRPTLSARRLPVRASPC